MRVEIDPDRCCSAGNCELARPDLFAVPEDGGPAVFLPAAVLDPDGVAATAAECPTGAIALLNPSVAG